MAADSYQRAGPPRRNWPLLFTLVWFAALFAAVMVVSTRPNVPILFAFAALIAIGVMLPVSIFAAMRISQSTSGQEDLLRDLITSVETLTQEGGLSEGAKRVLHRRQERELLRKAIDQDIADEDWDAAMVLVKELAERFGYRADAEEFRARIERARAQTLDRKVSDALMVLDDMIRRRQWPEAFAEAARVTRLYPDSHRVDNLRNRVDEARLRYRKELERRFLLAAGREQVDEAMLLLKELDTYLTPAEAEPFQEVARGVIGKLRENLGVRFKLAVQDHLWGEAIAVGEKIVDEFPNTRMAQEVRDLMPTLRERSETRPRQVVRAS